VDASVVGEFRVEGRGHGNSLLDYDRIFIFAFDREDFDLGANALDFGGADKDHFERGAFPAATCGEELAFADRAIDLASVGVAADGDVKCAQTGLFRVFDFSGKQNGSSAGAKSRLGMDELFQLFKSAFPEKLEERAGFSAGYDETVDLVELSGLFYQHDLCAEFFEAAAMSVEVTLQGKDADREERLRLWVFGLRHFLILLDAQVRLRSRGDTLMRQGLRDSSPLRLRLGRDDKILRETI
jgi:hypothetical protein